jgi:hypothetical protein
MNSSGRRVCGTVGLRTQRSNGAFLKTTWRGFNRRYRLELDSINDQFAQAFIKGDAETGLDQCGTIRQHISMAIQFASWARRKGYHSSTAYRYIEIDLPAREPETNAVTLTIEEIARLSQLTFEKNEIQV